MNFLANIAYTMETDGREVRYEVCIINIQSVFYMKTQYKSDLTIGDLMAYRNEKEQMIDDCESAIA